MIQSSASAEPFIEVPFDAALPGLTESAAPERMLESCNESLSAASPGGVSAWTHCSVMEAIYHPGRSCRIAYKLTAPDAAGSDLVYARWSCGPDDVRPTVRVTTPAGAFDLFRFPRDRRLRAIRTIRRKTWLHRASQAWFSRRLGHGAMDSDDWHCTPLHWSPESRLICRVEGCWRVVAHERRVQAEVRIGRRDASRSQFLLLDRVQRQLAAMGSPLAVPYPLAAMPYQHLLATECIEGTPLLRSSVEEGALSGAAPPALLGRAARALANIARVDLGSRLSDLAPAASAGPQRMITDLSAASPDLRRCCAELADWVRSGPTPARARGLIHGDLSARRILLAGERFCLFDWEHAHIGDPTRDATHFAADFDVAASSGRGAPACAPCDLAALCIDAWRSAGSLFNPATARWWAARAFVLRAWSALRHLKPDWPTTSRQRLERAIEIFRHGCDWIE